MTTSIKLYGSKAERFEAIKAELTEWLGYEPTNPEVMGVLMAAYARAADPSASPTGTPD